MCYNLSLLFWSETLRKLQTLLMKLSIPIEYFFGVNTNDEKRSWIWIMTVFEKYLYRNKWTAWVFKCFTLKFMTFGLPVDVFLWSFVWNEYWDHSNQWECVCRFSGLNFWTSEGFWLCPIEGEGDHTPL